MAPFKFIYGKSCQLLVELEHKACWAIKALNLDLWAAREKRRLELNELEDLHLDVYENEKLYKERTKKWHDSRILKREFEEVTLVFFI